MDANDVVLDAAVLEDPKELLDVDPRGCDDGAADVDDVEEATVYGFNPLVGAEAEVEDVVVGP